MERRMRRHGVVATATRPRRLRRHCSRIACDGSYRARHSLRSKLEAIFEKYKVANDGLRSRGLDPIFNAVCSRSSSFSYLGVRTSTGMHVVFNGDSLRPSAISDGCSESQYHVSLGPVSWGLVNGGQHECQVFQLVCVLRHRRQCVAKASSALSCLRLRQFGDTRCATWIAQQNGYDCGLFVLEYIRHMLGASVLSSTEASEGEAVIIDALGTLYTDSESKRPCFGQHDVTAARKREHMLYVEHTKAYAAAKACATAAEVDAHSQPNEEGATEWGNDSTPKPADDEDDAERDPGMQAALYASALMSLRKRKSPEEGDSPEEG